MDERSLLAMVLPRCLNGDVEDELGRGGLGGCVKLRRVIVRKSRK